MDVTVTRTELSDDSKTAKFLVSVFLKIKRGNLASLNSKIPFQKLFKDKNEMNFCRRRF